MATIQEVLRAGSQALAHLPSPRLDAEVLLGHVLGLTRVALIREHTSEVVPDARRRFEALVAARAAGQPIAYLRGTQEFWSLEFAVSPAVLVPRAETELLVTVALTLCAPVAAPRIADLGTGSGAVAIALARERPDAFVVAIESAGAALAVAMANRRRLGVANVAGVQGDWLAALAPGSCTVIVANPPYVADDDPALAGPGVCCEPITALRAGADGLDALRAIAAAAPTALQTGGGLALEHGAAQGAAVRALLAREFTGITTVRDLAGLERVTYGRRRT